MINRVFQSALLAGCVFFCSVALAGDPAGNFAVRGAGLIDCQTYVQEKEQASDAYIMMGGWMDGYLTGMNQLSEQTYDLTPYQSTELLAKVVDGHCRRHPDHRLFTVLSSIASQLRDERIGEGSRLVDVRVDGRSTRLYRETIRRMQSRLLSSGVYDADPSGQFDSDTLSAVMAYQESIGFAATGFPDQATLWKLFAD